MPSPRLLVLLLSLAGAGCAPIPHVVTLAPAISGTLTRDGQPVPDAEIRLARGPDLQPCSITVATARTDTMGQFQLEPLTQLRLIYAPLVAPLSIAEFKLCATTPDDTLLYRGTVMLYGAKPLKLHCALGEGEPKGRRVAGQPCRPVD